MIFVWHQSAVVLVIRDSIIIIIKITSISFPIFVMVGLVGIGNVGTIIQAVLVAVLINVLIVVALVTNLVIIRVSLLKHTHDFVKLLQDIPPCVYWKELS